MKEKYVNNVVQILEFLEVVPLDEDNTVRYKFRAPPHLGIQPEDIVITMGVLPKAQRSHRYIDEVHRLAYGDAEKAYAKWKQEIEANQDAPVPAAGVEGTLKQRGSVHGDFPLQSLMHDQFLQIMMTSLIFKRLKAPHRQALNLIAMKISRILNGDPEHTDHWHDIAGYAMLAEKACVNKDPNQAELPL